MKLFDKTLTALEKALDARLLRQNVLAGNLANVDTPGYRPREMSFEAALTHASEAPLSPAPTTPGHLPLGESLPQPLDPPDAPESTSGLDGNGVDLDRTMVAMAQNALQYGASARAAGKKLSILRFVVTDGNG